MSGPVFLFGTLRREELLSAVAGRPLAAEAARAPGWRVERAAESDWPVLVRDGGAAAEGILVAPDAEARARIDHYEAIFGYAPVAIPVERHGGTVEALAYAPAEAPSSSGEPWSLEHWERAHLASTVLAAAEAMESFGRRSPEETARRWPLLRQRAWSSVRAARSETPSALRHGPSPDDTDTLDRRRPYDAFFSVVEHDLRFRRFDGEWSRPVTRAAFVAADAVTVLPYDPVRDEVLLIEQYRFGPVARGDPSPWSLECIAGRIDPDEEPEATARREAREEAGLTLGALEPVARFYASSGALTEYVYAYVGLCQLAGLGGGVGGVAGEEEDILSHVIPFERLMQLVATGEAENAPLILSALWLDRNRGRLRDGGRGPA